MQIGNKSNILENKAPIDSNGTMGHHLTFVVIPESDVLLVLHGVEAGEPFGVSSHVARTVGIDEPRVL